MKKKILVDGVEYIAKDAEEVEVEEVETPVTPEEPVSTDEIDSAVEKIMKSIGIDAINEKLKSIETKITPKDEKLTALLDLEKLMKKDVSSMTAREKIVGFFQAMIQRNHTVLKALSEGTAADGGYLFPDEFRAEIIRNMYESPRMRGEVRVIPMRRDVMNIPTLESRPLVTWTEENAVKSTTTAHFNQKTLTVKKMAAIMYISDELVDDSTEIDVVNFIIELFAEAIGEEEDKVITAGNNSTQPMGYSIAGGTTGIATRSCSGNLDFDDIIDLEYDLPRQYQSGAKFYVHRNNIRVLRKLKDSDSRYLWQDPVSAGQPATFHGFPVFEDNNLPESKIFFGDLKMAYWLGDRQMMTVKISQDTETAFTKDQTAIRVVSRIAGTVVLPDAVRALINIP